VRFGLPVANGSVSLEVCLRALGVGPGDEVIVPGYTFVSTATAVPGGGSPRLRGHRADWLLPRSVISTQDPEPHACL
jgi:hypothetical protein